MSAAGSRVWAPASWSPAATTIAYVSSDGLDRIAPDGSDRRQLLPISSYPQLPRALSWSYDSKFLAYSAVHGIYVLPADGSASPRLVVADRAHMLASRRGG